MSSPIAVFGEMLWDLLPAGKQAGGAPMNVALHLSRLGYPVSLISRVGKDVLGDELLEVVREKGLDTDNIQLDSKHPTGTVKVGMDDKEEVVYDIVEPVAWDFIESNEEAMDALSRSEVLVYESLACRNEVSRNSLKSLLAQAESKAKVFDTNLRPPFYEREVMEYLLSQADLLKINHNELDEVCGWLPVGNDMRKQMKVVRNKYKIKEVIVTRGANGAAYLGENEAFLEHPGFRIEVEDTIGSGDSFLAAFLAEWVLGKAPLECLSFACALGAMVATHKGATPSIERQDIENFIKDH